MLVFSDAFSSALQNPSSKAHAAHLPWQPKDLDYSMLMVTCSCREFALETVAPLFENGIRYLLAEQRLVEGVVTKMP
jgi:hypothetical protein